LGGLSCTREGLQPWRHKHVRNLFSPHPHYSHSLRTFASQSTADNSVLDRADRVGGGTAMGTTLASAAFVCPTCLCMRNHFYRNLQNLSEWRGGILHIRARYFGKYRGCPGAVRLRPGIVCRRMLREGGVHADLVLYSEFFLMMSLMLLNFLGRPDS
jgi:hypothetical protein